MAETPDEGTPLENIRKVGWLLAAVGATFLMLGIAVPVAHQFDLATKTGRASGTIVDQVFNSPESADYVLHAYGASVPLDSVIEFRTESGALQRFQAPRSWPWVADHKGQEVPVAYDPSDPSQATINDIRDILYPLFICFTIGLSCLLGGTWTLTRFTASEESGSQVAA